MSVQLPRSHIPENRLSLNYLMLVRFPQVLDRRTDLKRAMAAEPADITLLAASSSRGVARILDGSCMTYTLMTFIEVLYVVVVAYVE